MPTATSAMAFGLADPSTPGDPPPPTLPMEWQTSSRPLAEHARTWESYLAVEGMDCPACSLDVEAALRSSPGVLDAQVQGATATARVVWVAGAGGPAAWLAGLAGAGYGARPAADLLAAQPQREAARLLLWRWLVAGFCMMQVMMYSAPLYFTTSDEITPDIRGLLAWASWLLTLPVIWFSCRPFFASAWRDVRQARVGMDVPVAIGIATAFVASSASTFQPDGPLGGALWFDSITMFVFFLLSSRMLEQRLLARAQGALGALVQRLPRTVERMAAGGGFERVLVDELAAGDRIRVLPGSVFPADGDVWDGDTLVDEALLTGESTPLRRCAGDPVIAGSHNLGRSLIVRVIRVGAETRFAAIAALMAQASVDKPASAQLADRMAPFFLLGVLVASAGAAAWWWSAGAGPALGIAIAVLIVTCPCALSLATPAATLASAGTLARRGVLVRRLQALERGASIDIVVFDKTGTLTDPRLDIPAACERTGMEPADVRAQAAALARHSLHPAARALAADAGPGRYEASNVTEIAGRGLQGWVVPSSGGPGRALRLGAAGFCSAPCAAGDGKAQVHLADEQGWLASFDLDEPLRPDATATVLALRQMDVAVHLLSGDRVSSVRQVAARLGINTAAGAQSPDDKLEKLATLQQAGHRVAMVGDGLNDGPVLARADLSVALGQAVPIAQAHADVLVPGGQTRAVPLLLAQARRTRTVIRQNLAWGLAYNALCVPLAAGGWMPPWLAGLGMAASSLVVVMNSARLAHIPEED